MGIAILIAVAAFVAVGINGIVGKLFTTNASTKVKTIVSVIVDAVIGVLIGIVGAASKDGALVKTAYVAATAVGSIAVADVGYDYVLKLIKSIITRLNSIKTAATTTTTE